MQPYEYFKDSGYERRLVCVRNNMSDFVIKESGTIVIDANGLSFKSSSGRLSKMATTEQLISVYGTQALKDLWDFALREPADPIDGLVKKQMMEILKNGVEK